jgi:hypothetical protein
MQFIEIADPGKGPINPDDFFDLDTFLNYWMDVADPRGTYLLSYQDYIMSGGGYY